MLPECLIRVSRKGRAVADVPDMCLPRGYTGLRSLLEADVGESSTASEVLPQRWLADLFKPGVIHYS